MLMDSSWGFGQDTWGMAFLVSTVAGVSAGRSHWGFEPSLTSLMFTVGFYGTSARALSQHGSH